MNDTKREELEKVCKKEKDHKVQVRMVAVRMVRVRNMPVEETAVILVRCPTWIRNWLRRYYEKGLQDPGSSQCLNAVEECRRQGKRRLLVSEYYRTFSDMRRAVSTCYRMTRFRLELINYVNKKTVLLHTNL